MLSSAFRRDAVLPGFFELALAKGLLCPYPPKDLWKAEFKSDKLGCLAEKILKQQSCQAAPGLPLNCRKKGLEAPPKNRTSNLKGNKAKGFERFTDLLGKEQRSASSNPARDQHG